MALAYDINGDPIAPGATHTVWGGDFDSGALPALVTAPSSGNDASRVLTYAAPSTDPAGVTLTTNAAASAQATLTFPDIDLSKVRGARMTAHLIGGRASTRHVMFGWRDSGSTKGVLLLALSTVTTGAQFRAYKAAGNVTVDSGYVLGAGTSNANEHNLALHLDPRDRSVTLLSPSGQVISSHTFAAADMDLGIVTPFVRVATVDGTAQPLKVCRLIHERWTGAPA